jgi:pimeloyl-ACP methyl ester carboxylesterase
MIPQSIHRSPTAGADRILLVMLPGAGITAADFAANGMVDAVHARALAVDIIAVEPALDLYLDGGIVPALHETIIAQAYKRIWLLGISLGGMGALLYASAHVVEGLVLLAPFLGTRGTVAEIARAGGLTAWSPAHSASTEMESRMLSWLQAHLAQNPPSPKLYLGYGLQDRFAPGHLLLAEHLPANRVITTQGGHDWQAWTPLWRRLLDDSPFLADRPDQDKGIL